MRMNNSTTYITFHRHLGTRVRNNIILQSKDGRTLGDRILSPQNHFFTLLIKTEPVNISRESYYIKYVMKQCSVVGE